MNVKTRTGTAIHAPALDATGTPMVRPLCTPMGANPWTSYQQTDHPVTCRKCAKAQA